MSFFGFCFCFPQRIFLVSLLTAGVRDWLFIFQKRSSLAGAGTTALIYLIQLDLTQFLQPFTLLSSSYQSLYLQQHLSYKGTILQFHIGLMSCWNPPSRFRNLITIRGDSLCFPARSFLPSVKFCGWNENYQAG